MYEDLGSDNLITCPRCGDQDALIGEICNGCKRELAEHHEYAIGWRKAWELEKDEELRDIIKANPDYVYRQLDEYERLAREFADDPNFSAAIAMDKATFERRWARVTKAEAPHASL